jgi:hypothetical protein
MNNTNFVQSKPIAIRCRTLEEYRETLEYFKSLGWKWAGGQEVNINDQSNWHSYKDMTLLTCCQDFKYGKANYSYFEGWSILTIDQLKKKEEKNKQEEPIKDKVLNQFNYLLKRQEDLNKELRELIDKYIEAK